MSGSFLDRHDVVDDRLRRVCETERCARLRPGRGAEFFGVAKHLIGLGHGGESLRLGLRRAAGNDDFGEWPLAGQRADWLARLAYRFGGDGAGVDHHGIVEPRALGFAADHFRLGCVEPAAEGDDLDAHDAASAAANKAASKWPLCSNSIGPVIRTWSSASRQSMARSPPGSVTVTLRPARPMRAAATAAAQAAEPEPLGRPGPGP